MSDPIKTFGTRLDGITYTERPGAYAFISNDLREIALIKTSYGLFLPGGGIDPGEDDLTGLQRELREEIGYELVKATFLMRAAQYHWSEFYRRHFKKIGSFYQAQATPPPRDTWAPGHALVWAPVDRAAAELSQEFQRWATAEFGRLT